MPRPLPGREQRRICVAGQRTGWGPRLPTLQTGHAHSAISKMLARHGLSRPPRAEREPERRYEWPCPGDLRIVVLARYGLAGRKIALPFGPFLALGAIVVLLTLGPR